MKLVPVIIALVASSAFAQSYSGTGVLPVDPNTLALQDACFKLFKPALGKDVITGVRMIKGDVEQSVLFEAAGTEHLKVVVCKVSNRGVLQLSTYKKAATKGTLKKAIAGAENNAEVHRFNSGSF
jgi:hypothetical protein